MRMFIKYKSVLFKIVLTNLVIASFLLILFVSSSLFYSIASKADNDANSQKVLNTVSQYIEKEITRLKVLSTLCIQDSTLVLTSSNKLSYQNFINNSINMSEKLALIKYSLPYAENVFAYINNSQKVVLSEAGVMDYDIFSLRLKPKLNEGEQLPDFSSSEDGFVVYDNIIFYISHIQNYGSIVIVINPSQFCNLIELRDIIPNHYIVLINEKSETVFSNIPSDSPLKKVNFFDSSFGDEIALENGTYKVMSKKMILTEYKVMLLSQEDKLETTYYFLNTINVIILIAFFVTCFMLVFVNTRMFTPLKNLFSRYKYDKNKNQNEFVFLEQQIDTLTAENNELSCLVNIKKDVQLDLLLNYFVTESFEKVDESIESFLSEKFGSYYCACITMQDSSGCINNHIFSEINDYLTDVIYSKTISINPYYNVIIVSDEYSPELLCEKIIRFIKTAEHDWCENIQVYVGVSDIHDNIVEIKKAIDQSYNRISECCICKNSILSCSALTASNEICSLPPITLEVQSIIADYISNGTPETLSELLSELLLSEEQCTLGNFLTTYNVLTSIMKIVASSLTSINEQTFKTTNILATFHTDYLYSCLLSDFNLVNTCCKTKKSAVRYPIIEYIENNFSKPLSLESVSEEFQITPVYLSTWFKKNVGINFSVYISKIRMETAKQILQNEPTIKLTELAEKVGIISVNTFVRQYKNHFGITPAQYREQLTNDEA